MTKSSSTYRAMVVVFFLLATSFSAHAVDVEYGIRAGASLTDNVFLDPPPDETDDLVYRAAPWLALDHESKNFDAKLRYRLDWYEYDDLDTTSTFHMGEASMTGRLWEDTLELELGASRMQVLREPDEGIVPGRLPQSGNLLDRDELYANPRIELHMGSAVTFNADYRYSEGRYDDPDIQEDINHDGSASIENYRAGQGLTWALRYDLKKTEYENSLDWEYRQAGVELGFWANQKLRLFGVSGKESAWDDPFNPDLADPYWEAGFAYRSGDNVSAEFAAGERSFDSSWRGLLELEFQRGSTSLSYDETPTTTGFDNSGGRQSVLNPDDLDEFLNTPGDSERFLSTQLRWDLSLNFRRSGLEFALFYQDQTGRIQADGTPLEDRSQNGVRGRFKWEAGARTKVTLAGEVLQTETETDDRAEYRSASLDLGYDVGARTTISVNYAYNEQRPRGVNSSSREYENSVISLYFTFASD